MIGSFVLFTNLTLKKHLCPNISKLTHFDSIQVYLTLVKMWVVWIKIIQDTDDSARSRFAKIYLFVVLDHILSNFKHGLKVHALTHLFYMATRNSLYSIRAILA